MKNLLEFSQESLSLSKTLSLAKNVEKQAWFTSESVFWNEDTAIF